MVFFDALNTLIKSVSDAGLSETIYYAWNIINISVITIFNLYYCQKYKISRTQGLFISIGGYLLCYLYILIFGWVQMGFSSFGSNNIVKGFCVFPLIFLLLAKIFKLESKRVLDFVAPTFPLVQCVAHLACNIEGCCNGYPMKNGIWNPVEMDYLFPCQLLESAVSLIIFLICIFYAKKQNYAPTGKVYPIFLILFGSTRFFLEFLRDNDKIIPGISYLALWALLMVIVGVIWLVVLKKAEKSSRI